MSLKGRRSKEDRPPHKLGERGVVGDYNKGSACATLSAGA